MSAWTRLSLRRLLPAVLVVAIGLGVAAWIDSRPDAPPTWASCTNEAVATPTTVAPTRTVPSIDVERVVDLDTPTNVASTPDGASLLVTTRIGLVVRVPRAGTDGPGDVVLDLRDQVRSTEAERGLLGMAVAPDGEHLYLHNTAADGDLVVSEWSLSAAGEVDPESARVLLREPDAHGQHNGGQLAFGPDGMLYIGIGDGGSPPDEGDPEGDAQDLTDLFGSILRIDPAPSGDREYTIPADNPFVDVAGARGEVFATGLRNPWRFSFDEATGDLWIGDVGHYCWEEINHVPFADASGANFGWRVMEGMHRYIGDDLADDVLPVWEYRHTIGAPVVQRYLTPGLPPTCGVIGGSVYRGQQIRALRGAYVYTDICADRLYALRDTAAGVEPLEILIDPGGEVSMGSDAEGELYVLTSDSVKRLVSAP